MGKRRERRQQQTSSRRVKLDLSSDDAVAPSETPGKRTRSYKEMEENLSQLVNRVSRLESQLENTFTTTGSPVYRLESQFQNQSSTYTTVTQDPADYGDLIRSLCPQADGSILPKPVSSSVADSILPPYDGVVKGNRILQADFKEWMKKINVNLCKNYVVFMGETYRVGKCTKKVDFHIVVNDKPSVEFYTVAVFGLLSHGGKFDGNKELGDLFNRLQDLPNTWRCKVVGGLTNGFECEWFVMEKPATQWHIEVTPIYEFRESLCSFLIADPTSMHMDHHIGMEFDVIRQLGAGRTSSVFLVNHEREHYAGKFFKLTYRNIREYELEILKSLEDVEGVPTVVEELLKFENTLFMKPVGVPFAAGVPVDCTHKAVFSSIVDIFHAAHQRGIIHRDVRMPNILLVGGQNDNRVGVMVIDWGFATRVGVKTKFVGNVQTGSDNVLKQLKDAGDEESALQRTSEAFEPLVGCPAEDRVSAKSSGKRSRASSSMMEGQNRAARITRAKARMMKEGDLYSFQPSDDLVSLVRTLLMHHCNGVQKGLRSLNKSDYEGHLKFWAEQMQIRPTWGIAQGYAENSAANPPPPAAAAAANPPPPSPAEQQQPHHHQHHLHSHPHHYY